MTPFGTHLALNNVLKLAFFSNENNEYSII